MTKYFHILMLTLLCSCQPTNHSQNSGVDDSTEEIVGGDEITRFDSISKYLVFIYSDSDYEYCTGTIVAPNVVLTAAHCIKDPNATLNIAFGLDYNEGRMEVRRSNGSVSHNAFKVNSDTERNDLALISFTGGLPDGFAPAPLATNSVYAKPNAQIIAVGYGRVTGIRNLPIEQNGSGRLRKVSITVDDQSSNKKVFHVNQTAGRGICYGDSGGPAFIKSSGKYYLVGVTSAVAFYKPKNSIYDLCKEHSVFMDVRTYLPWINKNLGQLR